MAKRFHKRRRACEAGFINKRDAVAEAAIHRRHGFKASVKRVAGSWAVCRTQPKQRRRG